MTDRIDGREVTVEGIRRMTNCRLTKTFRRLQQLLMATEEEIMARSGQGGGGLK